MIRNTYYKALGTVALTAVLLIPTSVALAQDCNTQMLPTTGGDRFVANGNGTVTDIQYSLMWSQCSVGQTLEEGKCLGEPTHFSNWSDALNGAKQAIESGEYGYADYRVPNIKELSSLVEYSCINPAINQEFFNQTPSAIYYSSTPDTEINVNSIVNTITDNPVGIYGRIIDFKDGTEFVKDINRNRYIRLVRDVR
jgi:hypothetical protein